MEKANSSGMLQQTAQEERKLYNIKLISYEKYDIIWDIQGGSNMTGTICV
jgi:hypothetical protein